MNEDDCPNAPHKQHEPDWTTLEKTTDGGEIYFDINCIYCGCNGCAGNIRQIAELLEHNVQW